MSKLIPVRSGLIEAQIEYLEDGVVFHAPLTFDEVIITETGCWFRAIDGSDPEAVEDGLTDLYAALFPAWCARRREAAEALQVEPTRRPTVSPINHTPCPTLWAGR